MYHKIDSVLTTVGMLLLFFVHTAASAYIVNINTGTTSVYLRVGDGLFTGTYTAAGAPQSGGAISLVQASVPAASVGNNTPVAMTSTARTTSDYDGYAFCNANQVYIGGFYRLNSTQTRNAILSVTSPAFLANGQGGQIAVNQISWTSSGNGDGTAAQPIPAGTFTGGYQVLANNFLRNTWRESCHSFSYANSSIVPAGIYNMRVTYTLVAP